MASGWLGKCPEYPRFLTWETWVEKDVTVRTGNAARGNVAVEGVVLSSGGDMMNLKCTWDLEVELHVGSWPGDAVLSKRSH